MEKRYRGFGIGIRMGIEEERKGGGREGCWLAVPAMETNRRARPFALVRFSTFTRRRVAN